MPKPYSNDFRQKVIEAIELNGLNKKEASQLFNISRNTINLWCRRWTQTGDIQPQIKPTSSPKRKIKVGEKFVAFVKVHGEKTQSQMAQLWEDQISQKCKLSFHDRHLSSRPNRTGFQTQGVLMTRSRVSTV